MARMLINNLANSSNTTITTENTNFPKANMYSNVLAEYTLLTTDLLIDLGSAKNITAISVVIEEISGGATITLKAGTTTGTTNYSSIVGSVAFSNQVAFPNQTYRYWRLETTIPVFVKYFYLGKYFQLGGVLNIPTPEFTDTDITNETVTGAFYTTEGIVKKEMSIATTDTGSSEYVVFLNWYESRDRINNFVFVPFEDDTNFIGAYESPFEPFFAKLISFEPPTRNFLEHEWTFKIREAK